MAEKKILGPIYIPGDVIDSRAMIRVNLAGEQGAIDIYRGQLKAIRNTHLQEMLKQEIQHRDIFQKIARERNVRITIFSPIWKRLAYYAGLITGKIGLNVCMATTVAVEDVIDQHYAKQLQYLEAIGDNQLEHVIKKFQQDERHHRDVGCQHGGLNANPLVIPTIRFITKIAIWLSERF